MTNLSYMPVVHCGLYFILLEFEINELKRNKIRNWYIFMPPLRSSRRHYVFGLSVRPSVRPYVRTSVRPYVPFLWSRYLKNRLMDSCQTLVMYVSCRADELIRFWGHEVKGQRSQGSLCMQKQLVIALSEEPFDGFLPNFDHVCILQSRWTD